MERRNSIRIDSVFDNQGIYLATAPFGGINYAKISFQDMIKLLSFKPQVRSERDDSEE